MSRGLIVVIGILTLAACSKRALDAEDGAVGQGGSPGAGGQAGSAADAAPEIMISVDAAVATDVRDTSTDVGDARVEMPPTPGSIPCGDYFCDATRMFCVHFVDGIAAGRRACYPLPSNCVGHGDDCACVAPGNTVCTACRVVTGADATGIERDCPGPID